MVSLYFVSGGDVCPGVSTTAKGPRSQVPACLTMSSKLDTEPEKRSIQARGLEADASLAAQFLPWFWWRAFQMLEVVGDSCPAHLLSGYSELDFSIQTFISQIFRHKQFINLFCTQCNPSSWPFRGSKPKGSVCQAGSPLEAGFCAFWGHQVPDCTLHWGSDSEWIPQGHPMQATWWSLPSSRTDGSVSKRF